MRASDYSRMKTWGPYQYSDGSGRRFVIRVWPDGRKQTVQHAKHVWEREHGDVPDGLHIHHVNGDCADDRLENLDLVDPAAHARLHQRPRPMVAAVCPLCGSNFEVLERQVRANQGEKGRSGPYCSRSCANRSTSTARAAAGGYVLSPTCRRGHDLSGENVWMRGQYRECRACRRERARAARARARRK